VSLFPLRLLIFIKFLISEHAVWFLHPFCHGNEWVNADYIRASIGTFEEILHQPSKYAARIAQAFTATDVSVRIHTEKVEGIEDLGNHTDGVGTISKELGDQIWTKLCDARRDHGTGVVQPSAVS
jgi:RNA-dependent RNA polymerase